MPRSCTGLPLLSNYEVVVERKGETNRGISLAVYALVITVGYYLECGDLVRVLASRHRCRRHCRCTYQAASCRAPSCVVAPQAAAPADASNTRLVEASADADARASSHAAATSAAARCSPCCSSLR